MSAAAFRPVSDGVGAFRSVFPDARVTSGYRPPNDPLSLANPNSFHTRTHAAVDVAPIPGMTFEQAKAQLGARFYVHPDSRDEVHHPSAHATGPHWHFVLGGR
jgi:soluble lytic murein transglycosylase